MILASNHPNAFLDAMIYGAYFKRRIHFLARGDVFRKPLAAKILSSIGLIPIYRIAEGYENLDKNKDTFKICLDILNNNGIVLIFSEGYCEQEWKLRPLLKGTGRLAMMAWAEEVPVMAKVLASLPDPNWEPANVTVDVTEVLVKLRASKLLMPPVEPLRSSVMPAPAVPT